jgi:hypothetical protein
MPALKLSILNLRFLFHSFSSPSSPPLFASLNHLAFMVSFLFFLPQPLEGCCSFEAFLPSCF